MESDSPDSGEIEPPEYIKLLTWTQQYLRREGAVVRQAPTAFAFAVFLAVSTIGTLMYWGMSREFADREESHKATVESKDATIKSLEAAIAFQDKKIAAFGNNTPTILENDTAKMVLINRTILSTSIPISINQVYQNKGNAAAIGVSFAGDMAISPKLLTQSELDFKFLEMMKVFEEVKRRNISSETQPGETSFFTLSSRTISKDVYESYIEGSGILYIFVISMYRDANLPSGKWRITETCHFTVKGLGLPPGEAWHVCDQHNQILVN